MNWLNINLTTLRSPAYLGSTPVERATWLQLLAYCVDQENGGRIAGAAAWKDRQWQQSCGITARELRAASRLVSIVGEDVCVAFYPLEKQIEVQQRRIAGTDAANRRWHSKLRGGANGSEGGDGADIGVGIARVKSVNRTAQGAQLVMAGTGFEKESVEDAADADGSPICSSTASPTASFIALPNAEGEWNENENEKEMNAHTPVPAQYHSGTQTARGVEGVGRLCSQAAALDHGRRLTPPCPEHWAAKWWEDCERRGWLGPDGVQIRLWRPALSSYWRGVQARDQRAAALLEKSIELRQQAPPVNALEINARIRAIDDELGRIHRQAREGRSPDGLRTIKLYTPDQQSRRDQLTQAKEGLKRKLTEV